MFEVKTAVQFDDDDVWIGSKELLEIKLEYIHQNPVKAGIVIEPWYYLFSSACAESPLKVSSL